MTKLFRNINLEDFIRTEKYNLNGNIGLKRI